MLADVGFYLLFLAGLTTAYGTGAALLAGFWHHRRFYRSARLAATASTAMTLIAAGVLWYLFFQRDYSVAYVFKNSSDDLPTIYRITAFWSSLEGSHFLWTILLSVYGTIAIWTASRDNEHIMPFVGASLMAVLSWMFYLLVSHSDPFVRMLPAPGNGQGMNALLQNPYMAIHPPMLFTGYTSLAIPAAYAVAALGHGDITEGWLRSVRRWALFAWCALTVGVALGGRWAYVELGWAGYWAWDPVENSSFIPWLLCTALLHALVVQDKLGHLKRLTLVLAFMGFFFSFFGTFITRSGIISSVHSFAESSIGPNYLFFLASLLLIVALLYGVRAQSILPPDADKVWGISRESALVVTLFLLLSFASIVCVGTLYPIVTEAITGERTTVQAPYFNAFAPWIGLAAVSSIAVGNLLRFQSGKLPGGWRIPGLSVLTALPIAALMFVFGNVASTPKPFALGAQVVGLFLCAWSISCLVGDLIMRLRDIRWSLGLFFRRNLAYFGAFVAHVGFIIAIVGFLGNYRGFDKVATLNTGETTSFQGYELTFTGLNVTEHDNATHFEGPLTVKRDGQLVGKIVPARSKYPTTTQLHHEVGLMGSIWHDLYVTLSDFNKDSGSRATFEMHLNPTVRFVWIAVAIMALGGLFCLGDRLRGVRSRDTIRAEV